MRAKVDIQAEVTAIASLPRDELARHWERAYGSHPTSGIRTELLVRAAAWHLQTKRLGGFSAETRRMLRSAMAEIEAKLIDRNRQQDTAGPAPRKGDNVLDVGKGTTGAKQLESQATARPLQRRKLTPGGRLLREWNGRTHVVDVIEGGFMFEAKVYPSLTAIAQTITGAHWSGPRFFGL